MRAWKVTAALAFTALVAAGIAPSLFPTEVCDLPAPIERVEIAEVPQVVSARPVRIVEAPEVVVPTPFRHARPPRQVRTTPKAIPMKGSLIPELANPITVDRPPPPAPPPEPSFWDSCPACGRG